MDYWHHQLDEPLYPDVVWSRPETSTGAGKIAVVGGSLGAMAIVAEAYNQAERAKAGSIYLLVPDSLANITKTIPFVRYAPSNPSGGFAHSALSELLEVSAAADGVLLAGDMGKNSETSLMLESFLEKYSELVIVSSRSITSFAHGYLKFLIRPKTILIVNRNQLRELAIEIKTTIAVTSTIGKPQIAELLHTATLDYPAMLIVEDERQVWAAHEGHVVDSSTSHYADARSAVWAIQQPEKLFEAVVSSFIDT